MRSASVYFRIIFFFVISISVLPSAMAGESDTGDGNVSIKPVRPSIGPIQTASARDEGVDWKSLARESWAFLTLQHGFRLLTEPGTREGMKGPFFRTYWNSVSNLHGWADGDPFYVNYVGHPMMGSVASFLFVQNDRRYRDVEFGKDPNYWKSRLRAGAFSFLYSAQFEVGPVSEASIGKIQRTFPQQGYVDFVITPFVGVGWGLAEDALDKFLIKRVEQRTDNNWIRLLVRGGLNPARSMANLLGGRVPWYRTNRAGVYVPYSYITRQSTVDGGPRETVNPPPGVAPFEFTMTFEPEMFPGSSFSCLGGGGTAAFRLAANWQLVGDVGGCKLMGFEKTLTGDSLTYLIGPRWTPSPRGRWVPHLQFLVGGRKITTEQFYPDKWETVEGLVSSAPDPAEWRSLYTSRQETNAFALSAGGGVDLRFNNALALRVASLEYRRSWVRPVEGYDFSNGLQLTTGLVLHMGTW